MTDSVKPSSFGRVRCERPSERPEWSGTASVNEGKRYTVITAHGQMRKVIAPTPTLAIRLVATLIPGTNFTNCCVTEGKVVKCLGTCNRCNNAIWEGDRHEFKRKPGPKPKTWVHLLFCEDCR